MRGESGFGMTATDACLLLALLRLRDVNYHNGDVSTPAWNVDVHRTWLGSERPGAPERGGVWERACELVSDYEFTPPELVRAVYDSNEGLLGRTMLLEGRFSLLRFYIGVRVTAVTDERRDTGERVWGFRYETLDGHVERGRLDYDVIKDEERGHVEFVMTACSRRSAALRPLLRLGWALFGRRRQLWFFRCCGQRMRRLTHDGERRRPAVLDPSSVLVVAPTDAGRHRLDRFAVPVVDPG